MALRPILALVIAVAAVAVVAPAEILPGVARLRAQIMPTWPLGSLIAAAGLALAAWVLGVPTQRKPASIDHTGLTVGLLFLLEPVLHLSILLVATQVTTMAGAEALLPLRPPDIDGRFMVHVAIYSLAVPIGEELFFRGSLLPWLQGRLGTFSAVTLSALCFAVAHGDLMQAVIAAPVGLLLGTMRVAGADLGSCMLAHAVHNSLFLCAGAGLVALPAVGPILAITGAVLVAFAWFFHLRPRPGQWRRFTIATAATVTVVVAILPAWQACQDRLWVAGVHRLCLRWRIDNPELFSRLLAQERHWRLTENRRQGLSDALGMVPCQTTPRQTGLCALLDPLRARDQPTWEDDAYELLSDLAADPAPRYDGDLARRLGACFPDALVDALFERPEAVPRWLPLPERSAEAALLLAACPLPRDRRALLASLEFSYPGAVSAVIFQVPAQALTPIEARHLRTHYPDWAARLQALAETEPALAQALGHEPTTDQESASPAP